MRPLNLHNVMALIWADFSTARLNEGGEGQDS